MCVLDLEQLDQSRALAESRTHVAPPQAALSGETLFILTLTLFSPSSMEIQVVFEQVSMQIPAR